MNTEELKRIITSQKEEMEEKFEKWKIIKREINFEKLKNFLVAPNILVVLGVRRCGKSILSWQFLEEEKFGYINFDDERLFGIGANDLDRVLQAFYELYGNLEYIMLDEIQNVIGWELFANRLRRTKRVVITGSNSKLLSGELATHLTGRYVSFTLFPFSFREYLRYNGVEVKNKDLYSTIRIAEMKRFLENYMKIGGLSESYIFGKEILIRIYSDIIEKDVLKRVGIKKKAAFKELAKYLISNFSSEFTLSKLSRIIGIKDVHTVKNWVDALQDAYLVFIVERYSPKLKEQFIAPKKIYCIDNGIISTIAFKTSENFGRLMENLVSIELLRISSYQKNEMKIYYWKDYQQNEVDFVIKEGIKIKQLIQVTYASGRDEIEKREIKALIKANEELKCGDLLVITWDYEDELKVENKIVKFIPLWKWLL